jgi:hypothetical protein
MLWALVTFALRVVSFPVAFLSTTKACSVGNSRAPFHYCGCKSGGHIGLGANILGSRNLGRKISLLYRSDSLFAFFGSLLICNLVNQEPLYICMLNFAADNTFYMSQKFSPWLIVLLF